MISLLGDFKIVLLDEPSSGMDPSLRRETWDILKNIKLGKIIILTTHYMDEAEYLGDRVAIMSHGELKTCGSTLFLKEKFSDAFLIEVTRNDKDQDLKAFEAILNEAFRSLQLGEEVQSRKDEANKDIYELPKEMGQKFGQVFQ